MRADDSAQLDPQANVWPLDIIGVDETRKRVGPRVDTRYVVGYGGNSSRTARRGGRDAILG